MVEKKGEVTGVSTSSYRYKVNSSKKTAFSVRFEKRTEIRYTKWFGLEDSSRRDLTRTSYSNRTTGNPCTISRRLRIPNLRSFLLFVPPATTRQWSLKLTVAVHSVGRHGESLFGV
jgi:hypothetical protein